MTIKREELDRREIDFSDVASGRRLPLVHPGEILRDEFLTPMEISVYRLAQAIKVSRPRLNDIVLGRRGLTTDTALRLGRYFGMTPEFWINLQTHYDGIGRSQWRWHLPLCRHLYVRGGWVAWLYPARGAFASRLAKSLGDGVGSLGAGASDQFIAEAIVLHL